MHRRFFAPKRTHPDVRDASPTPPFDRASRSPPSPHPRHFRLLSVLAAYHILLVVGGLLAVVGTLRGSEGEAAVGWVLLGSGVALEVGILGWAAQQIRHAAANANRPSSSEASSSPPPPTGRSLCPNCGQYAAREQPTCSRCGHATVPLPG